MRDIDSFFQEEVSIPLYHYTGIGSLLGMSQTGSLWASSISYLNDSKEMIHAYETVENVLRARLVFGERNEEYRFLEQFQAWVNSLKDVTHTMFIFSLSEERSLLSQWRSYTPHGKGISLEFSPERINAIANRSNLKVARCLYEREEQEEAISSLIEKLIFSFRQGQPFMDLRGKAPDQCYYDFIRSYQNDIFQVLAIIKHHAFQEEKEWRLISRTFPNFSDPELRFREGSSMLVPYIEVSLGEERPFFESITLGPTQDLELSFSALSMFMSNQNLSNRLRNCGIPYREWN